MARSGYYHRDLGVVCYELPLFATPEDPCRHVPDVFHNAVLGNDLEWCWRSSTRPELAAAEPAELLAGNRPLSPLTAESFGKFEEDVRYFDDKWSLSKGIELFGYDPGASSLIIDDYDLRLRVALEHFVAYEGGPLRLVVMTADDEDNSMVFVPHRPIAFVATLLEGWGAPSRGQTLRHKYRRLGVAKIEDCYALPLVHK